MKTYYVSYQVFGKAPLGYVFVKFQKEISFSTFKEFKDTCLKIALQQIYVDVLPRDFHIVSWQELKD